MKQHNVNVRKHVLSVLYRHREMTGIGYVSQKDLEEYDGNVLFALSVLAEFGLIQEAGGSWRITAAGVVAHEKELAQLVD